MIVGNLTFAEFNRRHEKFWREQKDLMERRLADKYLCEGAYRLIARELISQVPFREQLSFEQALAHVESERDELRRKTLAEFGRRGGSAKKIPSALVLLIEQLAKRNPKLTEAELLAHLRHHQCIPPIQDINNIYVYFTNQDGATKKAKLSGLKHLLSRTKKRLKTRPLATELLRFSDRLRAAVVRIGELAA